MGSFIRVRNGYVNGEARETDVRAATDIIRAFLHGSAQSYETKTNPEIYREILRAARIFIGNDFKSFVIANYVNGLGPTASIVNTFSHYLEDKVSARSIISTIRAAEIQVRYNNRRNTWEKQQTVISMPGHIHPTLERLSYFDYYRIIRGIGIEYLARYLMVLLGENVNE